MSESHDWFRDRLGAHLLGVLPDDEDARFRAHADECEPCGALLAQAQAAREDWWEDTDHLPVTLLARWESDRDAMSAADSAAIAAHLESCDSCRADLDELAVREELIAARPALRPEARPTRTPPTDRWRDWMRGGFVGALAAAAAFVLTTPLWQRAPHLPAPGFATRDTTSAPAVPTYATPATPESTAPPLAWSPSPRLAASLVLADLPRSGGGDITRLSLRTADIVPIVPPLLQSPAPRVTVELADSLGRVLDHRTMRGEALLRAGYPVDLRVLRPGVYALRVRWASPDSGETKRDFPFVVLSRR